MESTGGGRDPAGRDDDQSHDDEPRMGARTTATEGVQAAMRQMSERMCSRIATKSGEALMARMS